ncbi:MAG: hypothetical protein UU40_C0021G0008 [Candidatus Uhrbacteria bacterium GW2011_GWD2_41_121]|uniref:DHHA1 domain-containing protein n=1 Tax=Candidatus Uhrbacteria bacterium GW2011_GWC1_41_20 TaxID=1618983 RepID=A0A0G0VBW6_9BACT|nr:MAG: hypothetical protein UT52_C0022G0008 [Candidatus Uhrbacteria bacterium GW2011_GWE1_39_46]KKR63243.1 MAG: hypothetical protein UU04_C0022G0011 [Candidatus Uhrbacteria bacterium GW2011_GWC2_40_450]KKR89565.1 MAG: hypothetical protein UU40_C0021G0008 [Candidatus Uhrbacteria bacterium GW2011_GWD2_41_121]KKR94535.1 MAG: hypothetical protein UU46_C0032G0001 [Candidatus Uhrbacteria bacterium GW2011_GWD1_41_16]KKR98414.1 MAG: hypothetical protein UU50_C0018G0019 [Candidatus Uhrbacteria bacteriu
MQNDHIVLICPRNDEESLLIIKIAKAIGLKVVISNQGHGAKLELEQDLINRIKDEDQNVRNVVIVEIPGVIIEEKLRDAGIAVNIIDHHQYNELNRLNDKSSLEQFLELYEIDDQDLKDAGFDPMLVRAVAAVDRGFLWELQKIGLSEEDQDKALRYIKELIYELGHKERKEEEAQARKVWGDRREEGGFLIIESDNDEIDIRDAVSYLIFEEYKKPTPTIIRQGNHKLYVQETDQAQLLIEKYGGFLFGSGRCWGIVAPRDGKLPGVEEVLGIIM